MEAGPLSACIAAQHSVKCNEAKHGATTRSKGHAKFRRENNTITSQTTDVQVRACVCHETHGADCGRWLWQSGHLVNGPFAAMQTHDPKSSHHTTTHNSRVNNAAASRVRCRRERCDRACCCRGLGDHTRPQHRPNDHGHGEEPRHRGKSHTPPSESTKMMMRSTSLSQINSDF